MSNNKYWEVSIYFIFFILIGSLLALYLFVGVIFYYFKKVQKTENNIFLTTEQSKIFLKRKLDLNIKNGLICLI